jgi:DNA gyrase inhibitor GyrI
MNGRMQLCGIVTEKETENRMYVARVCVSGGRTVVEAKEIQSESLPEELWSLS